MYIVWCMECMECDIYVGIFFFTNIFGPDHKTLATGRRTGNSVEHCRIRIREMEIQNCFPLRNIELELWNNRNTFYLFLFQDILFQGEIGKVS